MPICNKCHSNDVVETSEVEKNTYKESDYYVDIEYSICNACEREFISKPQIIANEAKVREAKKEINGLLSSVEIRNIRKFLNLSQIDAAHVFGGGRNAFSKYERSEVTQSVAMDKLLRLVSSDRYIYHKLLNLSELKVDFQFVTSIDMSNISIKEETEWFNNDFDVISKVNEVSKPRLRVVA